MKQKCTFLTDGRAPNCLLVKWIFTTRLVKKHKYLIKMETYVYNIQYMMKTF